MDSGFQVPNSSLCQCGPWILDPTLSGIRVSLSCIPDSKAQDSRFSRTSGISVSTTKNLPDSGIWIPLHWANQSQGSYPFLTKKIKDFSRTFQGHISHFSRTPFSAKKSLESMSFSVLPEHEQFYPEGLSVFAGWDKVSTEI